MTKRVYPNTYTTMITVSHTMQTPAKTNAICNLTVDESDVRFMVGTAGGPNSFLVIYEKDGPSTESYHEKVRLGVCSSVCSITLLPSRLVAVGFEDGYLRLYSIGTDILEIESHKVSQTGSCTSALAIDDSLFVGTECGKLMLVSVENLKKGVTLYKNMACVTDMCEINAHSVACGQIDGSIVIVDTKVEKRRVHLRVMNDTGITSIANHPKFPGLLAFGTEDGRVGFIDTMKETKNRSHVFTATSYPCPVWKIAYHPKKSNLLYTSSDDGSFIEWDAIGSTKSSENVAGEVDRDAFASATLEYSMQVRHLIKSTAPVNALAIVGDRYIIALECSQVQIVRTVPHESVELK
uniref:WD_REPEATS_REGION domain-containing protein n=1 Tax=Steinernema glaseri TaxID=37863 RepID=A0A1I7Z5E3_9BILA